MNKIIRIMQTYLIVGLPFVILCMVWSTLHPQNEFLAHATLVPKILWHALAFNLMFWFLVLVLFLILLVAVPSVREKTLLRLANIKERDEREAYITGKAARITYLSTLSLMILLLFFSIFSLTIYVTPQNNNANDHRKHLTVGMGVHFSLLNESQIKKTSNEKILFESKSISLSTPAVILILLCWQLLSFNLTARRML